MRKYELDRAAILTELIVTECEEFEAAITAWEIQVGRSATLDEEDAMLAALGKEADELN